MLHHLWRWHSYIRTTIYQLDLSSVLLTLIIDRLRRAAFFFRLWTAKMIDYFVTRLNILNAFIFSIGSISFEQTSETYGSPNDHFSSSYLAYWHAKLNFLQYANKQFQRPLPQMNMGQTLAFQQQHQLQPHQWEELRRRQLASPRGPVMLMDKGQQMLDVKIENMMDAPIDNSFSALKKHQLLRQQQQQLAMANHQAQSAQQFNQLPPVQLPQLQAQYDSKFC